MRTALAWLYAAATLVVTASAISVLVNPLRNPTIAVISTCADMPQQAPPSRAQSVVRFL